MRAVPRFSVRLPTSSTSSPSGITSSRPDGSPGGDRAAGLLQALHGPHPGPQEHVGERRCRSLGRRALVRVAACLGGARHKAGGLTRYLGSSLHRLARGGGDLLGSLARQSFNSLSLLLGRCGLLDPQLGLPGQELGFLALLPGLGAPLLRLVLPGLLGLGEAGFHLLGDALHLLLAQRPLHCRQQLRLLVPGVLAEDLLQLLEPLREGLVVLRQRLELGELGPQLAVVPHRVGHEVLGFGVAPEHWEEVLLLEAGVQLELGLQLGKQLLPGLHRAAGGLGNPGEQLVHLGGAGQHQGSEGHGKILGRRTRAAAI